MGRLEFAGACDAQTARVTKMVRKIRVCKWVGHGKLRLVGLIIWVVLDSKPFGNGLGLEGNGFAV